jgi:2-polyprenyl-6-methoxyphenol hydroxylase-like FAD-dependent oxidoreductase
VRWATEVTGVRQDAEGVEVTVEGPGGTETLSGRYLVGCDGGRSTVRKLMGVGFPGTDQTMVNQLGDVELAGLVPDRHHRTRASSGSPRSGDLRGAAGLRREDRRHRLRNAQSPLAFTLHRRDAVADLVEVVTCLVGFEDVNHHLSTKMSGLDVRYPMPGAHPLLGRRVPDADISTRGVGKRVFELLRAARPVLLDLSGTAGPGRRRGRVGRPDRHRGGRLPVTSVGGARRRNHLDTRGAADPSGRACGMGKRPQSRPRWPA